MGIVLLTTLLACADKEPEPVPQDLSLIDAEAWTLLAPSEDPWSDVADAEKCSPLGYGVEGTYFEIDTEQCPYGTFGQPALHGVAEGDEMTLVYWHLDLWSDKEGAQGHVAISIGGEVFVDDLIDIPAEAEVHPIETVAPRDIEAGELITFHLHNHGYNNWSIGVVEAFTVP